MRYLTRRQPKLHPYSPPLYKLLPPPHFRALKEIILQDYTGLKFQRPRFIALRHPTLYNRLVCSAIELTDNQLIETALSLDGAAKQPAALPRLRRSKMGIVKCRQPRCITCKLHLNTSTSFKSIYPGNKTIYYIRHSFTCESTNIVYLITCTKCKKQYVGHTTHSLRKMPSYIYKHFNLQDHDITNLKAQPIDAAEDINDLSNLEKYWIASLVPFGLNVSY